MSKTLKCGCTAGVGFPFECPHGNDKGASTPMRSNTENTTSASHASGAACTGRASDANGWRAQKDRLRIRERDGYRCRMCKRVVTVGEVDHIIPVENGGSNDDSNLQLLCSDCHRDKTASDRGYVKKTGSTADGMPTSAGHHWNT
jgi:5-methylcytosine-specific restriction endonuclease McrA